jgi:hypothetical protein
MRHPAGLYLPCGALLVLGLLVAPRIYHNYDVVDCFLAWARASGGTRPWEVYRPGAGADDCDYPPLVPYALTLAEAARRLAGAPEVSRPSVVLVKLPSLLAQAAAIPLVWAALRGRWGEKRARRAALLLALSPALFVNSAAWGQFDVPPALFVIAALIFLLHDRPVGAGMATGAAIATKLLAVVVAPLFALWIARRHGWRRLAVATGAGIAVTLASASPHVLGGAGPAVLKAYTGAVDYYPYRTGEAYNGWYLLDRYDMDARRMPGPVARRDDRPAIGPLTFRDVGLAAFAAYAAFAMAVLWRRPRPHALLWCTGMLLFGFFMLPTQVHQRYIVPAVAVLALLAPLSARGAVLFAGLTLTATLNQGLDLLRAVPWTSPVEGALTGWELGLDVRKVKDVAAVVAAANVSLFLLGVAAFIDEVVRRPPPASIDATAAPPAP